MSKLVIRTGILLVFTLLLISSASSRQHDAKVHTLVEKQLTEQPKIPVIVILKEQPLDTGISTERQEFIDQKRATVAQAKQAFKTAHAADQTVSSTEDLVITREYWMTNALAMTVSQQGLEALKNNPAVDKIIPDENLTIDRGTISGTEISLNESAPVINADDVANITVNGANLTGHGEVICVIDTGIDHSHLFFGPVVEATGIVGGIFGGYDFVNNDANASDDNNHGTHVSGIASGNFSPYFGVARNARVIPVKVCNAAGSCPNSAIVAGVDYCNNNFTSFNVSVISGSLGGGAPLTSETCSGASLFAALEPSLQTSLTLNITPVFASGNNDCSGTGCTTGVDYPACSPNVVSVGSTTKADAISTFTDRGGDRFDIYAPGQSITSSIPPFNTIGAMSGTSQATPHVSGAIAVIQQNQRLQGKLRLNLTELRALLKSTGKPIPASDSRIDLYNAIAKLNQNYTINLTDNSVRNDTSNSTIRFIGSTDFSRIVQCTNLSRNNVTVDSTACPQYNKTAHIILGGVTRPAAPQVNGGDCPATTCQNITLTRRGLEMDVTQFSSFTSIPGCPTTINDSTQLNQSINSNGTCITFGADNIELDCAGYNITYANTSTGYGINATGRNNITIRNCNVYQANFTFTLSHAIILSGTNYSTIVNNTAQVNGPASNPLRLESSGNNTIANNTAVSNSSGAGVLLTLSHQNNITNTSGVSNSSQGIRAANANNNRINNVTGTSNSSMGIQLDDADNTTLENSTGISISGKGIDLTDGSMDNTLTGNNATSNTGIGLEIASSQNNTLARNIITSQQTVALSMQSSNNTFTNNTIIAFSANTGINIASIATGSLLTNNRVSAGGLGISIGSSNNILRGNIVNTTDATAILITSVTNNTLANNTAHSLNQRGIQISASNNNTLTNNTGTSTNNIGIDLISASANNTLTNNTGASTGGAQGISLNGVNNNLLIGNIALATTAQGLFITSANANTLNNNTGTSTTIGGIVISASTSNTVENNTGISTDGKGILLQTSANFNTLAHNRGISTTQSGIALESSTNNNITNSNGTSNTYYGITFNASSNNRLIRSRATSQSEGGVYLTGGANLNTLNDSTFQSNTAGAVEFGANGGQNNAFTNSTLQSNATWIKIEEATSTGNTFNSTLFDNQNGSIRIIGNFTMPDSTIVNYTNVNITFNRTFVNSTNVSFLNQSSQITLKNLPFSNPQPVFDENDTGNFSACPSTRCQVISSSGGTLTFNVTSFTAYSSAEGPGIVILKTDTPDPVVRGSLLNYTILVNNTGNATLFNVTITEAYPTNIALVTVNPPATSGNGTFVIGTLVANQSTTINITVRVSSALANGTILNNTANVTSQLSNGTTNNATITQFTTVQGIPVIFANKTSSPNPVPRGTTLSYQVNVVNTGDEIAYNVTVVDFYPLSVIFNGSQPAPIGNNTFNIGNLLPGQSNTVNITINVSSALANGTILNNTVNITFANLTGTNASVTNNTLTSVRGSPNVTINKTDNPDLVFAGDQLVYRITINNTGDDTAFNITIVETYPANTAFITATPPPTSGTNTFLIQSLNPGQSTTINITLTANSIIANNTVINNTVNATFANSSGQNLTINTTENTTVIQPPRFATNKTANQTTVIKGTQLNYTIIVNNTGETTAFNVTVTEGYPSGTIFHSSQPLPVTSNNTFSIGTLQPNQATTINITVNTTSILVNGSSMTNTFNVTANRTDGRNISSGNSTATTVIGFPVIAVVKTDTPDPVRPGNTLTYQITITNNGDEIAYNVMAVEDYPTNVILNTAQPAPSPGNNTFNIGNLLPGQTFVINITLNVSSTFLGLLNNTVNVTFTNTTGQALTVNATQSTTVSNPPPAGQGGGSGGGGGASGVSTTTSMSGNTMNTAYLRPGDKVKFTVQTEEHTMTVLNVISDTVSIRIASVPQEFALKKGAVQTVDVNKDGTQDLRVSVVDIAYSKALFKLEKLVSGATTAAPKDEGGRMKADEGRRMTEPVAPEPAAQPTPQPAQPKPVPEVLLKPAATTLEQPKPAYKGIILIAALILIIAAALIIRKYARKPPNTMQQAENVKQALKDMDKSVKESMQIVSKKK